MSGTTSQFKQAKEIAKIAKKNKKTTIIGGPHATPLSKEILLTSDFDFVVIGEGEITLFELLNEIIKRKKRFENIKGLMFRKNGVLKWLKPDGKSQVTVEYDQNDVPVFVKKIVIIK